MMSIRKFPEVSTSGTVYVAVDAAVLSASPGVIRFPTSRPRNRANVDITMKYSRARPPTLPTWEALRTDPMPSTIVQKMIGPIIILIRFTNAVPITANPAACLPKIKSNRNARDHRDNDSDVQPMRTDLFPLRFGINRGSRFRWRWLHCRHRFSLQMA